MSDYRVNLDIFAGPMDLLLYLIRKDEVDIYDIPISEITDQYVRYIDVLKDFDIDLAGDFLVMAATLMHIKSAMLLPKSDVEDGVEDGELIDPRSELIGQLLEYKKFKDAANLLESAAQSKEDRFGRPSTIIDSLKPESEPEFDMEQVNIWDLLEAFDRVMKATGSYFDISHIKDDTPIDLYQIDILDDLQKRGAMSFESIFEGADTRIKMISMFLALLELSRGELIRIDQDETSKSFFIKALTDEPAAEAVQRAILVSEEEELLAMQEEMEKKDLQSHLAEVESGEVEILQGVESEYEFEDDEDEEIDISELLSEVGVEALESSEVAGDVVIPIFELPAEKKKSSVGVKIEDLRENYQVNPIPILELPSNSKFFVKPSEGVEVNTAENNSD